MKPYPFLTPKIRFLSDRTFMLYSMFFSPSFFEGERATRLNKTKLKSDWIKLNLQENDATNKQ